MSRQQIRSSGDGAIDPSLVQKKRARHRLVGAICLCLIAAVIVPMVLESEPRPRDRDLPIELAAPDRSGEERSAGAPSASGAVSAAGDPAAAQSAVKTVVPPGPGTGAPSTAARSDSRPAAEATRADVHRADAARAELSKGDQAKGEQAKGDPSKGDPSKGDPLKGDPLKGDPLKGDAAKADAAKADAAKQQVAKQELARQEAAKAAGKTDPSRPAPAPAPDKPAGRSEEPDVLARLIDRNDGSPAAGAGALSRKFLVQIGAYSNVQSARTVSDRVVQVGLRPYQETVKTANGDWIRVRVGPFSTRQDAERAQQDLKRVGVPAAIIAP